MKTLETREEETNVPENNKENETDEGHEKQARNKFI